MFCPKCGNEKPNDKQFCGECGVPLVQSPTNKQLPPKSKNNNFIIGLIVFIILAAIFYNPIMGYLNTNYLGKPSPQKIVITPIPTPNNQFKVNEPATDGNLRVTFLGSSEGRRMGLEEKMYYVKVKFENLRSDKEIQVFPQDFELTTKNGAVFTTIFFYMTPSQSYDLGPGQWGSPSLEYVVPLDAVGSKLKFDFSRPSGVLKGGKVVYFIL
jgi:hypothetical protein